MEVTIRNVDQKDKDFVLELNRVNVEVLSPMDEARFQYFVNVADMFQVVEADGEPVAFLIVKGESVRLLPVAPPPATTVDRVIETVPEVVDKVTGFIEKQQEKKAAKAEEDTFA